MSPCSSSVADNAAGRAPWGSTARQRPERRGARRGRMTTSPGHSSSVTAAGSAGGSPADRLSETRFLTASMAPVVELTTRWRAGWINGHVPRRGCRQDPRCDEPTDRDDHDNDRECAPRRCDRQTQQARCGEQIQQRRQSLAHRTSPTENQSGSQNPRSNDKQGRRVDRRGHDGT